MARRLVVALLLTSAALALPACWLTKSMTVPMKTMMARAGGEQPKTAIILLPGYMDDPEDLQQEGLIRILEQSGLSAELITVDAHFAYYRSRTLLQRLELDVIGPARSRGIEKFWLLGISMGGIGALLYAKKHAEDISGLVLIAPFLGDDDVLDEIRAAGGLANWNPAQPPSDEDYQRSIWFWLRAATRAEGAGPKIFIGWGQEDDFATANRLLADVLPAQQVIQVPGGHDWEPWRNILQGVLRLPAFLESFAR